MTNKKQLEIKVSEDELQTVRKIISNSLLEGSNRVNPKTLYSVVNAEISENTRLSAKQIEYLTVFEQALGLFRTTALELRKQMDVMSLEQRLGTYEGDRNESAMALQNKINETIMFSNRYALYFTGQVGLSLLKSEKADTGVNFSFGTKYDFSKDRDDLTGRLAVKCAEDFLAVAQEKKKDGFLADEDLKYTLEAVFTTWINQFKWETWEDIAQENQLSDTKLQFGNYSLAEGDFSEQYDVIKVEGLMKVKREEAIGNEEFRDKILWNNFLKLGGYNHNLEKNPFNPPKSIFVYGAPGGGKTFTAHGTIQSFGDLCRERRLPLWAFSHSTTDYASHYQNQTANKLAELGKEIKEFPGMVIMYIADADTIFQSRKDPHLTSEQKNTLSVYMRMFDGTMIPKNGKFLAVMDANYLDGVDDATKSRVFDIIYEVRRFEKAGEFEELVKRSLSQEAEKIITISDPHWKEIGEYLLATPLSNREIGHVLNQLKGSISVTEEMLGKTYEEQVSFRNEQLREVFTKDNVLDKFEKYINIRMEIERASHQAKALNDRERFLEYLASDPGHLPK